MQQLNRAPGLEEATATAQPEPASTDHGPLDKDSGVTFEVYAQAEQIAAHLLSKDHGLSLAKHVSQCRICWTQ